jgi:hypothetical protein
VLLHVREAEIAACALPTVRRRDVQAFLGDLLAAGLSTGSASNVLNPLQAFYRRAVDREDLMFNPTKGVEVPTGSSETASDRRPGPCGPAARDPARGGAAALGDGVLREQAGEQPSPKDTEPIRRGALWLHNRKRPAGEAGRFWGYYREERYVSLYMWIRGR